MKISGNETGRRPQKANKVKTKPVHKSRKNEKSRKNKAVTAVSIVVGVLILTFCLMGAYANGLDTVYENVSMEGVELGGLTAEEAATALTNSNFGAEGDKELDVTLPAGVELTISASEAGCYMSAPDAAEYTYELCHGGNFFSNTFTYLRSLFGGIELNAASGAELDEDYLSSAVDAAVKEAQVALMDNSIEIDEDSLSIVKGAKAVVIDSDELYDEVKDKLLEGDFEPFEFEATSNGDAVEEIDLQAIYDMVYSDPVDAEYDPDTKEATEASDGVSFDMDEAQELWDDATVGELVVIPLILTEPDITTDELNAMLFSDQLSQKTTSLSGSSSARINNVTKAAAAINGTILNPGEEFSYNDIVGQRTTEAGYLPAGAYSGGQVVTEVGGGICQVSSTLYYCALVANLEITARTCHYFGVSYLPAGLDATVSWPSPNFKFVNSSDYPIKIEASVNTSALTLTVKIYGSNPDGISVEITTQTYSTSDGYGATSYRNVYDKDGNLISSDLEAKSVYHYHVDASPEPSPSPSPSPEPSEEPSAEPSPSPSVAPSPSEEVSPSPTVEPSPSAAPSPSVEVSPD